MCGNLSSSLHRVFVLSLTFSSEHKMALRNQYIESFLSAVEFKCFLSDVLYKGL